LSRVFSNQQKEIYKKQLAYAEVISYNKKNLERELKNESRQQAISQIANRQ
jgi:G3E family GTPase